MESGCLALKDLISPRKRRTDLDGEESNNDHKENICTDLTSITPSKQADRSLPEPLTPTANLKVLMSAASPDIRDREMRKVLFRSFESGKEEAVPLEDSTQCAAAGYLVDEFGQRPSRKQKSLGLLCQKFLSLYPDYPAPSETTTISLDEVATSLGVERRRIYDIVNVLESLLLVSRVAKNRYLWHGRHRLQQTLRELQGRGRRQRYHLQMDKTSVHAPELAAQMDPENAQPSEDNEDASSVTATQRKDKSLRIMSQKFIMLFLVSETGTVTLDVAAKILIEESQDIGSHSKYKTKVRRLYDIANVLTSLGLIQKVYVKGERGRKPAFRWIGPTEFRTHSENLEKVAAMSCPAPIITQQRASSTPSCPLGDQPGSVPPDYKETVCKLRLRDDKVTQNCTGPQNLTWGGSPVLSSPTPPPRGTHIQSEVSTGSLPPPCQDAPLVGFFPSPTPLTESAEPRLQYSLAHFPSLPQASVVMLYGGSALEGPDRGSEGQRSPSSEFKLGFPRKRKMDDEEEQEAKQGRPSLTEVMPSQKKGIGEGVSPKPSPHHSLQYPSMQVKEETPFMGDGRHALPDAAPPSYYLCVPNSSGLNGLNILGSAGHPLNGLSLPPLPALAVPCVLLPSSALSHYQLTPSGPSAEWGDGWAKINLGVPVLSSARFAAGSHSVTVSGTSEMGGAPSGVPCMRKPGPCGVGPAEPPVESAQPLAPIRTEPRTPLTPKEPSAPRSPAFFQTPGSLGHATPSAARRRGSAQRRLDIGQPPAN